MPQNPVCLSRLQPPAANRCPAKLQVRTALGDLDGAIVALEEALRLPVGVPHHTFYYQQLGMVKCKKAERTNDHVLWDAGLRALARAVQADPLNVNAWATAATNYMALGHERSAMRATEAAARLGTAREQALSALGVNYARVGRVSDAIRLFTQAWPSHAPRGPPRRDGEGGRVPAARAPAASEPEEGLGRVRARAGAGAEPRAASHSRRAAPRRVRSRRLAWLRGDRRGRGRAHAPAGSAAGPGFSANGDVSS
jgi:tetratricopeptide (TPR) repeat protein